MAKKKATKKTAKKKATKKTAKKKAKKKVTKKKAKKRRAAAEAPAVREQVAENTIQLGSTKITIVHYAFSPDGKRVLCSEDKTIRLWDMESRRCLRVFKGHTLLIHSLTWSTNERRALSGSSDKTVRLWDVETGRCLRVFKGHTRHVLNVAWSADERRALSCAGDFTVRLWDVETGRCLRVMEGHTDTVCGVTLSADNRRALSSSFDNTVRLWDVETGRCLRVLEGHTSRVRSVTFSANQHFALSGADDNTVRLWNVETGRCLRVFQGHTHWVLTVAWSPDQRLALSGSVDNTMRLWDVETGHCLGVFKVHKSNVESLAWSADGTHAFSGEVRGGIRVWDLSEFVSKGHDGTAGGRDIQIHIQDRVGVTDAVSVQVVPDQVQYTNAKVLLVGDTSAGKTGLAHRLATGKWKATDGSTVGAWSTQWKLSESDAEPGVDREIWLWDFGGQADQRLIHQLYMDRATLILLMFNADQEDVLPGLRDWQTALQRSVPPETKQLLVAGRIDTGFKASRTKLKDFAKEQGLEYHETSAMEGTGCNKLRTSIMSSIPWANIPVTTTEDLFKLIEDEILKLRDEGQVLHTFKELRALLWKRLSADSGFTDEILQTVIGLLDAPGVVKELDYGTYILLQPEWVNIYAQAVIRTLRSDDKELGCLPIRSIAEGKLIYQSVDQDGQVTEIKRLPPLQERIVLGEMERQLNERGLCLRQGDKLVFPSHCGRDRPKVVKHPSVFVSYDLKGYLDDIYATLVVKLADSDSFKLKELWRNAADFDTLEGAHRMGIKLTRDTASIGNISVYFGPGVSRQEQVIFANYIHAHLEKRSNEVKRLRYYVCPKCNTPKGNPQVLMEKLLSKKEQADTECDKCGNRFPLWDALEKKFASKKTRELVEDLQTEDVIRLDARRKGKLLVLEVGARISSANQKWHEIPQEEDEGIDIELEFTDDNGKGTGKRMYLQLKAGNSHLKKRKKDGVEVFHIKKQRWVKYWMSQPEPVMLVIGTFAEDDERTVGKDKLEFDAVRWMEIGEYLKRESDDGKKAVKQIIFEGERFDVMSVRRWREKALVKNSP